MIKSDPFSLYSRLNVVNYFRHASIQIGDKAFYTVKPCDVAEGSQVSKVCRTQRQEEEEKGKNSSCSLNTVCAADSENVTSLEAQPDKTTETAVSTMFLLLLIIFL